MLTSTNVQRSNDKLRQSMIRFSKATALSILCLSITSITMAEVYQVKEHVIKKGETLSDLSIKYNVTISAIKRFNKINNDDGIKAGVRFLIPLDKKSATSKTQKPTKTTVKKITATKKTASVVKRSRPTANKKYTTKKYKVQAGDNLTVLAAKNNISLSKLLDANNLDSTYQLWTSDTLYIPVKKSSVVKSKTKAKSKAKSKAKLKKARINKELLKKGSKFKPQNITITKIETQPAKVKAKPLEITQRVLQKNAKNQITYAVVKGDTLAGIAKKFKTTQKELIKLNDFKSGDVIDIGTPIIVRDNTDKAISYYLPEINFVSEKYALTNVKKKVETKPIFVSQAKEVVSKEVVSEAKQEAVKDVKTVVNQPTIIQGSYTVQPGDNLAVIAKRFNTTQTSIIGLNGISNSDLLQVGQVLKINKSDTLPDVTPSPTLRVEESTTITTVIESGTY